MATHPLDERGSLRDLDRTSTQKNDAPDSTGTRHSYAALDGLRGIAAVLVVLYHAEFVMGFALVPNGYLAVDLFFAISGFVIALAYDERLSGGLKVGRFALMRMVRFWPLYLLGLMLGLAVKLTYLAIDHPMMMTSWKIGASFALNGAFLPAVFPTYGNVLFPLNPVSWSLFFELLVNILYACFLPLLSRRVVAGLAILSGVAFAVAASLYGTTNVGWASTEIWLGLVRTIFSFSAGVWIFRSGYAGPKIPFGLLAAAVLVFLSVPLSDAARPFVTLGFILIVSPMIVAAGTNSTVPGWAMRTATWLGAISYALYAVHKPLLSFTNLANERIGAPGAMVGLAYILAVCALCGLLDRRFDRPVRRWLNGRLGMGRRQTAAA